jgi:DNA polymerase III subunit delta'
VTDDIQGPDQYPGTPHPRVRNNLIGHGHAEQAFLESWRQGSLHHAWLLAGMEGIGKATFAYRVARFLLANPPGSPRTATSLAIDPASQAARQTMMLSHPDLRILRRQPAADGKKAPTEIKVDDVRDTLNLFMSTSATGGWRIIIVDAVEELNRSGANALLKMLEEPPLNAVFLVVCHVPGRLLPTIRSRCRVLPFESLSPENVLSVVESLGEPWSTKSIVAIKAAAARADGSVRRCLSLLDPSMAKLITRVDDMLARVTKLEGSEVLALAETLVGRDKDEHFATALRTMFEWVAGKVSDGATLGPRRLAPLVEVWEKIHADVQDTETYNLDRRPLVISIFDDISDAVRRSVGETA